MTPVDVHPRGRELIFQRGLDGVVTGIAANIKQTAACEFAERNHKRGPRESSQGPLGKWRAPAAIERGNPVIEVQPGGSTAPNVVASPSTLRARATYGA